MAEAFGVAAGAVGVISLGIQLAESLQKVKDFCSSVKNAPSHIAELIEEIEIMRDILSDLEDGCLSVNVASSPNTHRCLKIAQRATTGLVSFSNQLQVRIKKSRFRGGAKFALSRDEIKQMLNQLERTKSSLMLAYSIYREAIADDRYAEMMAQAASWGKEPPAQNSSVCYRSTFFEHKLTAGKKLFQLTTPRWMSDTVWQLEMRSSFFGLNIFTRSYGIVPDEAPIFHACRAGDDIEMRRLFESGLASPYDQTEDGINSWDLAFLNSRIKSFHCLNQYGVATQDSSTMSILIFSATIVAADPGSPYDSGRSLQEDLMWLRDACCHNDYIASDTFLIPTARRLLSCPPAQADSMWIWHLLYRSAVPSGAVRALSRISVKDLLSDYIPQDHCGMTPLHILAVYTASRLVTDESQEFGILKDTISAFITNGAELDAGDHCQTPLLLFLNTLVGLRVRNWDRAQPVRPRLLQRWLVWWLEALQHCGVDLDLYGLEEERTLQIFRSLEDPIPLLQHWHDMTPSYFSDDIFYFKITYGPLPEDWTVQVDPPLEQYACDFWQMTHLQHERQSLPIPGSWIDAQ